MTACVIGEEGIRAIISDFCFLAFCFISNYSDDKYFCWASCPIIKESQRKKSHCGFLFSPLSLLNIFPFLLPTGWVTSLLSAGACSPFSSLAAVLQASVVIVTVRNWWARRIESCINKLFRSQQKSQHCYNCCLTWADTQHLGNLTQLDCFHLIFS